MWFEPEQENALFRAARVWMNEGVTNAREIVQLSINRRLLEELDEDALVLLVSKRFGLGENTPYTKLLRCCDCQFYASLEQACWKMPGNYRYTPDTVCPFL